MPVTVRNTDILFNDGTTQGTAVAPVSTAFDGVGSYVVAYYAVNPGISGPERASWLERGITTAGSNLRVNSRGTQTNNFPPVESGMFGALESVAGSGTGFPTANSVTLTGTWRLMTAGTWARGWSTAYGGLGGIQWYPMLWVRIA